MSAPCKNEEIEFEFDPDFYQDEGFGAFRNSRGRIRLFKTRKWFLENWDPEALVEVYKKWVSEDEYLHLAHFNERGEKDREVAVLASKRGNRVYIARVRDRITPLLNLKDLPEGNRSWNKTRMLFITLTYNTRLKSPLEAWQSISEEFNSWITNLRNKFGELSYLKVFESTRQGFPHLHLVLLFRKHEFSYFALNGKFRIPRKQRDRIKEGWHSFVDVEAVVSPRQAIAYVIKYLLKIHGKKEIGGRLPWEISLVCVEATLALLWVYKRRGFSVSQDLEKALLDLIPELCATQTFQLTLDGDRADRWVFLGLKTPRELGILEDPPPFFVVLWEK